VQAFRNLSRFRGDSRFYTWLVRITINEGLMRMRRRRLIEISIDDSIETEEGALLRELKDCEPTPEQRYSQEQLRSVLATTIDQLPPGYRDVFQLRDVEGFRRRKLRMHWIFRQPR
jgi:RNA polymerase sigma-70 factor, ECF subfamily